VTGGVRLGGVADALQYLRGQFLTPRGRSDHAGIHKRYGIASSLVGKIPANHRCRPPFRRPGIFLEDSTASRGIQAMVTDQDVVRQAGDRIALGRDDAKLRFHGQTFR